MQRVFGLVQEDRCVWRIEMGPASFVVEQMWLLVHIGIVGVASSPHYYSDSSDAFTGPCLYGNAVLKAGPNSENDAQGRREYKGKKVWRITSPCRKEIVWIS